MKLNYAIVFVSDMQKSIVFYRDVIGLSLQYESPHWTEFATEGASLALHESDPADADGKVQEERPGSCRPGIQVPDLDAFHARMVEHKVRCIEEPKEQFGARLAQYADPDGLSISIAEVKSES